jgi:hypothetical protein
MRDFLRIYGRAVRLLAPEKGLALLLAAANVGLAAAYQDWDSMTGSIEQLGINLISIVAAGTAVLAAQRWLYLRRRAKHLDDPERRAAGLPATRKSRATTRSRPSS